MTPVRPSSTFGSMRPFDHAETSTHDTSSGTPSRSRVCCSTNRASPVPLNTMRVTLLSTRRGITVPWSNRTSNALAPRHAALGPFLSWRLMHGRERLRTASVEAARPRRGIDVLHAGAFQVADHDGDVQPAGRAHDPHEPLG